MAAPLDVVCPTCKKSLKLPAELAGKKVKCKGCQAVLVVPGGGPPAAAAAAAIPLKPEPPPPPPPAPIGFAPDDDDDPNPYGVVNDGLDVPRCPFCAKELDPPDTKICLNCGYDMMARRRHETVKVWAPAFNDYAAHLGPGIACVLVALGAIAFTALCFLNMRDWMTGGMLDADEKDPITQQTKFYIPPYCFNLWIGLISGVVVFVCTKFAIKRLVYDWKPAEKKMKT